MRAQKQTHLPPGVTTNSVAPASNERTKDRRFMLLPPEQPRTRATGKSGFKASIVRLAYPVMPKGLRVETGSRDMHKAMSKFLNAAKAGPMSTKEVAKHLLAVSKAGRLLVGWNGEMNAQAFKQCLQMQVADLPMKDLKQLLAQIDKVGVDTGPAAVALLRSVRVVVRSECVERFRSDLRDGDFAHIPGTKDQLDRLQQKFEITRQRPSEWTYAVHAAVSLLSSYGLLKPGSSDDDMAQGRALLMELCTHFVSRGDMKNDKLIQLFKAIPPREQALLLQAKSRPLLDPDISQTAPLLLEEAIIIQGKDLRDALDVACTAFNDAASSRAPLCVQAEKLADVAHAWSALTAHCAGHAVDMDDATTQRINGVCKRARGMDLSDLGEDVLGHARLSELESSLDTLGIAHNARAFADEVLHRKQASTAKCVVALNEGLNLLAAGDLEAGLAALVTAQEKALKAMQVHEELGADLGSRGNVRSADGHQLFYSNLFNQLFDTYPDQQERWFEAVNQKQVQLLASALPSVAEKKGQKEGGADIVIAALGGHLANIKTRLAERLGRQDDEVELSPYEQRHDLYLLDKETQDAGDAITGGFVTQTQAARHQPFDAATQEAIARTLAAISPPEDGVDADALLRIRLAAINTDMKRTGYVVEQKGQPGQAVDNAKALRNRLEPTDAQLDRLARLAGIDLWQTADSALASPRSPVLDSEGAPIQPTSHLARTTCHISRGNNGQLELRMERVLSKPGSTVHLSLTISIAEDGSMTMTQPVSGYGAIAPANN
jgi:hypothetical protein